MGELRTEELRLALSQGDADTARRLLHEARLALPHGSWIRYVESEVCLSRRQASRLVREFRAKPEDR